MMSSKHSSQFANTHFGPMFLEYVKVVTVLEPSAVILFGKRYSNRAVTDPLPRFNKCS